MVSYLRKLGKSISFFFTQNLIFLGFLIAFSPFLPWQISLLLVVVELFLAIVVDNYYENLSLTLFGDKSFFTSNWLLDFLKIFRTNSKKEMDFEKKYKRRKRESRLQDNEEFLISELFTSEEFHTYNKRIHKFPVLKSFMPVCFVLIIIHLSLYFLYFDIPSLVLPSFSTLVSLFFISMLFIHIFLSKGKYAHLQMSILLLNNYFNDLNLTLTGISVTEYYHPDVLGLKDIRVPFRAHLKKYMNSAKILTNALFKLKLGNFCLSIFAILVPFYFATLIFGLELNFLFQIFVDPMRITVSEFIALVIAIITVIFLLIADPPLVFHHGSQLFLVNSKKLEIKNTLFEIQKNKSDSLKQASLDLKENLMRDIASITNFVDDVDLILKTRSGYPRHFRLAFQYLIYTTTTVSGISIIINFLFSVLPSLFS